MATIRPFRGLRPTAALAAQVASPPYDVLSREEARRMAGGNPYSFLRVNKAEIEFDDAVDPYSDEVYRRSRDNLHRLMEKGVLVRDPSPCFYAYRLTMGTHRQLGLAALCSVEEYQAGIIRKHELTRPEKVADRARHILITGAQVGPVLVAMRRNDEVMAMLHECTEAPPAVDFTADDGIRHELWVIEASEAVRRLQSGFENVPVLYIADGHHRSEAAAEAHDRLCAKHPPHRDDEPYNYFLTVIFDERELQILPYNRVVSDIGRLTPDAFMAEVAERFVVEERDGPVVPAQPHHIGMYFDHRWYELVVREGLVDDGDPVRSIDAAVLSELLLAPVLEITDIRRDKRIDFIGGIRGTDELVRLVDSGRYRVAFSLYATTVRQLMEVADAGKVMPPKSTWFEPKLRSGMVVNLLEE